jgi:hypothetical protein
MERIGNEKYVDPIDAEIQQQWRRPHEAARKCGIKKSRLYQLLIEAKGEIKTCVLKSPGAARGARLINLSSLLAYIERLAKEQQKGV